MLSTVTTCRWLAQAVNGSITVVDRFHRVSDRLRSPDESLRLALN